MVESSHVLQLADLPQENDYWRVSFADFQFHLANEKQNNKQMEGFNMIFLLMINNFKLL